MHLSAALASLKQACMAPSITSWGATFSQGLFLFGNCSKGYLGNPSKDMRSPGLDPFGGMRSSTTDLVSVSAHMTIPCEFHSASFLALRFVKTTTNLSCKSSIFKNFCRPLAIVRISPFPISTFSLYKFSLFGFFSTHIILPTLKSHLDNSCKSSAFAAGFFGAFWPFYYCYFSFLGFSYYTGFSPSCFSPYFCSSCFLPLSSGFPCYFLSPSYFFFSSAGAPPAFFSSFLALAALIFSNFFNYAFEGSD